MADQRCEISFCQVMSSSHAGMYTGRYSSDRSLVLKCPTPNGVMKRRISKAGVNPVAVFSRMPGDAVESRAMLEDHFSGSRTTAPDLSQGSPADCRARLMLIVGGVRNVGTGNFFVTSLPASARFQPSIANNESVFSPARNARLNAFIASIRKGKTAWPEVVGALLQLLKAQRMRHNKVAIRYLKLHIVFFFRNKYDFICVIIIHQS